MIGIDFLLTCWNSFIEPEMPIVIVASKERPISRAVEEIHGSQGCGIDYVFAFVMLLIVERDQSISEGIALLFCCASRLASYMKGAKVLRGAIEMLRWAGCVACTYKRESVAFMYLQRSAVLVPPLPEGCFLILDAHQLQTHPSCC